MKEVKRFDSTNEWREAVDAHIARGIGAASLDVLSEVMPPERIIVDTEEDGHCWYVTENGDLVPIVAQDAIDESAIEIHSLEPGVVLLSDNSQKFVI